MADRTRARANRERIERQRKDDDIYGALSNIRDLPYDSTGEAAAAVADHVAGVDPHPQYAITTDTGWSAMTGAGVKTSIPAAAAGVASAAYVQAELQAALNRIAALEARMKAYDATLFANGIIGA